MRFGAILVLESGTKKLALSDMAQELYTILHKGQVLFEGLTQTEYLDKMMDLAEDFYAQGTPNPSELETKITTDN